MTDLPDPVRDSYDAVAADYADRIAGELAGKPVDRALYRLFAELVGAGLDGVTALGGRPRVGDVGCGPGHVTAHLRGLGLDAVGVDLSAGMVAQARAAYPDTVFRVGSMLEAGGLGVADGGWDGAVAAYSVIHFDAAGRAAAFAELARAIRARGWLLVSVHTGDADATPGAVRHLDDWWGHPVDLDFVFADPDELTGELAAAGFAVAVRTDRQPWPHGEAATRRCHLLARRDDRVA